MLFSTGRRDEAIDLLRQAIARDPTQPATHRDLGSLLEKAGQAREAAAAYREYARLAPGAADARQLADRAGRLDPRRGASEGA
jgi:tetratricopeptide (TPR) repeat protein